MKSFAVVAALFAGALAVPQAVTSAIAPQGSAPAGCLASAPGSYEITVVKPTAQTKRDLNKRAACGGTGTLVVTLQNGVMKDALGRTAYIASNRQFQFDAPPQAGAVFTSGFSVCGNSSIALGSSTVFYQCLSGSFYNLYDTNWAPQCTPVAMDVIACEAGGATSTGAPVASQSSDGQPIGTTVLTQLSDAQPNGPSATTAPVLTQLSDAQPNGPSAAPIPLSQFSDGQPQMPTPLLSQLSDAQPVATGTGVAPPVPSNGTVATPTPSIVVAGAPMATVFAHAAALVAGVGAIALL